MILLLFLIVILMFLITAAMVKVDKQSKESVENLQIAVDKLNEHVQSLERIEFIHDREQEHL